MLSFEEQLIERVQRFENLYNAKSKHYKNSQRRDSTWLGISQQLGVGVEQCRQRWKSLRDRFVGEHRKIQLREVIPDSESDLWEHYNQLLFLKEYIHPTPKLKLKPNFIAPPNKEAHEEKNGTDPETDDLVTKVHDFKTELPELEDESDMMPEMEYSDGGNYSVEDASIYTETPSKRFKPNFEDAFVDCLRGMAGMVEKKHDQPVEEETVNSLFMKMIAKKMDLLPLSSQGSLQVEILTLVNNEMKKYVNRI